MPMREMEIGHRSVKYAAFLGIVRVVVLLSLASVPVAGYAQELPYFVTYTHHMEEPGSLEVAANPLFGRPDGGHRFVGLPLEVEYGTRAWWTSELYLEGQTTVEDSTVFTGVRIENRLRPLLREHRVNPVLYAEFEDVNGANRSLREVVGHDGEDDVAGGNAAARAEKKREVEAKLILSSDARGWNLAENFIAEKNIRHAPWEFGYALAAGRPLRLAASTGTGGFLRENFSAAVEMYGGLGSTQSLTLGRTAHYAGPSLGWHIPDRATVTAGVHFGLTGQSLPRMYRVGVSYEIGQLGRVFSREGGR
ncbi:MAG: hypothetical protein M3O02_10435 [Acidobacteriota bacterium]|nr:hypothetical protein [Acidobacteriota bacterium]